MISLCHVVYLHLFFFFNDTATTEIYTLSLHDALPISAAGTSETTTCRLPRIRPCLRSVARSEEHTSELQSRLHLVCRLLLEKKKKKQPCQRDSHTKPIHSVTIVRTPQRIYKSTTDHTG